MMTLQIGWGQCNITPKRTAMLDGQFYRRVATQVKDPLTATVMALESEKTKVLLISCDLVGIYPETLVEIRETLKKTLPEVPSDAIILNATHTHAAPVQPDGKYEQPDDPTVLMPEEFRTFLAKNISVAAADAWKHREPGGISRVFSRAVVGHNRRSSFLDGTGQMYAKIQVPNFDSIEGFEDHSLHILCTWDRAQNLTGIIINTPCPSQVSEHISEVSADFWHETRLALRQELGESLPILAQCAPAGDQSPHVQMHKTLAYEMYERLGRTEREEIGRRICTSVMDVMPAARDSIQENPKLVHLVETLHLPRRRVTDEEKSHAIAMIDKLNNDPEYTDPQRFEPTRRQMFLLRNNRVLDRYAQQDTNTTLPMELHILRLGDVVFTTSSFELYLDFGLRINARSVAAQTFQIQLACGYDGYLPSERAMQQKMHSGDAGMAVGSAHNYGASVGSNFVGADGGQVLVDHTVKHIAELFDDVEQG